MPIKWQDSRGRTSVFPTFTGLRLANLSLLYKDKFSARPSHGGGCCPGPLRFIVDLPECTLVPTPSMDVMGIRLNSEACTARLSGDRVGDLLECVSLFTPRRTLQLRRCLGIPAIVVSAISLVCLGGLHMGPFQRWFRSLHVPTRLVRHRVGRDSGSPFLLLLGAVYALILSKAFSAGGYSQHVGCGEVFPVGRRRRLRKQLSLEFASPL